MTAGESAYDVARRQREKAARLARSAELWEKGAAGEIEVARVLADLPPEWVTVHDLPWPARPRANIDHVVIGPGGVYVVDAKNWSGAIEVRDGVLRQNGHRREQAVASAQEAAIAIQQVVRTTQPAMGVLCFIRDEPMVGRSRDVMVCSTGNLREMLSTRPQVLTPDEVQQCADAVRRIARGATNDRRSAPSAASRRSKKSRRGKRLDLAAGAALVVAMLVGVQTGAIDAASRWLSERLVANVGDQDTPAESPTQPAKNESAKKKGQSNKG